MAGYECFHCGQKSVYWSGDFDFSDYCLEGEGIIHECKCSNCGAEITYKIPIPDDQWWIFTFGCGHEHAGKYVKIRGSHSEARAKMFEKYGDKWAFQYSEENWEEMKADKTRMYRMETELEVIE